MRPSALLAVLFVGATAAAAQAWDPRDLAGGRLRLGGEASFSIAAEDRGFFNYTDYQDSWLRMARVSAAAEFRLSSHVALLGELRTYNFHDVKPYGLYLRVRPWADRDIDLQVGRIPPVFGAFPRRGYGADNPLIGLPQAYQYLTNVRPDALPANADDMVRMRGEGWLVRYPLGNRIPTAGMPLVASLHWDTGVQVRIGTDPVQVSAAVTQGTLGSPQFEDDNDGKQLAGRVAWTPVPGMILGASGAQGEYLARTAEAVLSPQLAASTYRQQAWGADVEYSRDHWLVRSEAIWSNWDMPAVSAPLVTSPLHARSLMLEGRYKIVPGVWVAARFDDLVFDDIEGTAGPSTWDAPVRRLEIGAGFAVHRYIHLKACWQRNRRDGGEVHRQDFLAAQVLLWY